MKRSVGSSTGKEGKKTKDELPYTPESNIFNTLRARLLSSSSTLKLTEASKKSSSVVLWMSRDQRVDDNHALYYAYLVAKAHQLPLKVVFNLVPKFLEATLRQYGFMIKGLMEVEEKCRELRIAFHLSMGEPVKNISNFAIEHNACILVTDFSPLRVPAKWVNDVVTALEDTSIPVVQVDAHNVVPCWHASDKLEYGARTIRG